MKKILIIMGFALVMTSGLFAQGAQRTNYADKKQVEDFFKSKTMVVLDANQMIGYNIVINDAMKKYWTITPFEVIKSDEFDKTSKNSELSFIFLSKVQLEKDKEEVFYLYMNFVMGADVKDLVGLPELLSIPLAYEGVDEDDYIEKLPAMLRFAQLHLNNLKTAKNLKKFYFLKNYNADSKLLKNMTLLLQESDLSKEVNSLQKIKTVYPGAVKIVSAEEIAKAVENKTPKTAVLHQISPGPDDNKGRFYCQIYDVDSGKLYYYDHQNISQRRPVGMSANDFRKICKKWKWCYKIFDIASMNASAEAVTMSVFAEKP